MAASGTLAMRSARATEIDHAAQSPRRPQLGSALSRLSRFNLPVLEGVALVYGASGLSGRAAA
jgi:hypothetical protein